MKKQEKHTTVRTALIANGVGLLLVGLLYTCLSHYPAYSFVVRALQGNYATISKHRGSPLPERYTMKLKSNYIVYAQLVANTPADAVIYLPSESALAPEVNQANFHKNTFSKGWALRFLYPRKVVLESEYATSIYTPQITHVAIINGVGADKLPYRIKSLPAFGVLPIDPSKLKRNTPPTSN